MSGLKLEAASWLNSPAGQDFMVWFRRELELDDTLTPQELYNRHRPEGQPPVPIDPLSIAVKEGRSQAYKKLVALADAAAKEK